MFLSLVAGLLIAGATAKPELIPKNSENKPLIFFIYKNNDSYEGRVGLFDSQNLSIGNIAKFNERSSINEVATTQNQIFAITSNMELFEIYDLNTRQISKGPDPPEWREDASVAYFKDKLYYLGGKDPETYKGMNRIDVLIDGEWQARPAFPLPIKSSQTITCNGILYVIDGGESRKIYRLSDDEREWVEIGELPEKRTYFGVASLNGRIYITGGFEYGSGSKSCLCFDPSAPVNSRISQITDMSHARYQHSLVVANGKLYAIGGFQKPFGGFFCNSIEEYDPQTNEWREVGKIA